MLEKVRERPNSMKRVEQMTTNRSAMPRSSLWVLTVFLFGDGVGCMMMPLSTQVLLRHFRELSGLIDIMLPLPFFSEGDGGHHPVLFA
jgi:hypothetical protein